VTSHGHAVARISAVEAPETSAARAREVLLKRLKQLPAKKIGRWTRDELYEDETYRVQRQAALE
jgi:antitoxin (DNA-binding transcriptional repressor) of toxin-antitoxin stability system